MSSAWKRVKWTLASQVFERAELRPEDLPEGLANTAPATAFQALVADRRFETASSFLAQALPRFETAAWAGIAVSNLIPPANPGDRSALSAVHAWIADPTETSRRACFGAAEQLGLDSPARYAALAVFFSGGSIAPEGAPDVEPQYAFAGRFSAGAIGMLASLSQEPEAAYLQALDIGANIAAGQISKLLTAA